MVTIIIDSEFNVANDYKKLFANTLIEHFGGMRNCLVYVCLDKKQKNVVYPDYAITIEEAKQIGGGVYLTTSRAKAEKMIKSGNVAVLLDLSKPGMFKRTVPEDHIGLVPVKCLQDLVISCATGLLKSELDYMMRKVFAQFEFRRMG